MKKPYLLPEFEVIRTQLTDNLCTSNPEGYGEGGNWGGNGESEAGEE